VTNPTDPKAIQVYEGFQGPDNEGLVGSFMSFVDTGASAKRNVFAWSATFGVIQVTTAGRNFVKRW
jgi:hypothetical protein